MESEFEKLLNQEPHDFELQTDKNGLKYIPSAVIEELLTKMYSTWGMQEVYIDVLKVNALVFINARVTLHIIPHEGPSRYLTGCAMFPITGQEDNTNYSSIALSMAICDAAKRLGKRFGRDLNGRHDTGDVVPSKGKPHADDIIRQQFKNAIISGDVSTTERLIKTYSGLNYE